MVNQVERVEKTTTTFLPQFSIFRQRGREINLENRQDVDFSEIAPGEVAVFCRFAQQVVTLIYVYNQERFDYQKQMNDLLLILSKDSGTSSVRYMPRAPVGRHTQKKYRGDPFRWQKVFCS